MEDTQEHQDQSMTGNATSNAFYQSATALQIRLDTSSVVSSIEMYIKGEKIQTGMNEQKQMINYVVKIGEPLLNEEGIQFIMNFVGIIFNPQVVQGNFPEVADYEEYIYRTRVDLAEHLMKNLYKYEIKENNYNGMISTLMRFIEAFMSRLIKNKERDSYSTTIKTNESNVITPSKGGGMKLPFT